MHNHDLFKEIYMHELDRRQHLDSSLSLPLTVICLIIASLTVYLSSVIKATGANLYFFVGFLLFQVFFLLKAVYYLWRSYANYNYHLIPNPKKLKKYFTELESYYEDNAEKEIIAKAEFDEFMVDRFANCSSINLENNIIKAEFIHKANAAIIISILFTLLTSFPYFNEKSIQRPNVQNVRIVGMSNSALTEGDHMKDSEKKSGDNPSAAEQEKKKKPVPPDNIVIRTKFGPGIKEIKKNE